MSPGWTQCIDMMLAGLQFPVFTTASEHQSVAGLTWGRGKVSEVRLRGWAEVEGLFLPVWPIVCARASSSGLLPLKQRATHTLRSCFCLLYNTEQWAETLWPPPPKIARSRLFKGKLDFAFLFPAFGLKFWLKFAAKTFAHYLLSETSELRGRKAVAHTIELGLWSEDRRGAVL